MAFPWNLFYFFLEILSNGIGLVFWEFKHFYKISLFSFLSSHFLHIVLQSFYVLTLSTFSYFFSLNTHNGSALFFLVVLQSLCILMLSTFCTFCITSHTKTKTESFNWPPIHFLEKFTKSPNMNNLFVCIIISENNNKQNLNYYFYQHIAFLDIFL